MVSNRRGPAPAPATTANRTRIATPVMLAMLATLFAGACSSNRETMAVNRGTAAADTAGAANAVPRSSGAPAELTGATLVTDGDGPRLLLSGSQPLTPTIYTRDDGRRVVVDLPDTVATAGLEPPRVPAGAASLSAVQMRSFTELGRPHVQFEMEAESALDPRLGAAAGTSATAVLLATRQPESAAARPTEAISSAASAIPASADAPSSPESAPRAVPAPEPVRVASAGASQAPAPAAGDATAAAAAAVPAVAQAASVPAPANEKQDLVRHDASGRPATRLTALASRGSGGEATVRLTGDGDFSYEAFVLSNPPRYVIDLAGVKNVSGTKAQEVKGGPVTRVRVSQFRTEPEAVTRVVFDLDEAASPRLVPGDKSLRIEFKPAPATVTAAAAGKAAATPAVPAPAKPAGQMVRIEPAAPAARPAATVAAAAATTTAAAAPAPAAGSYEKHEVEDPAEKVVPAAKPEPAIVMVPAPPAPAAAPAPAPTQAPELVAVASPEVRTMTPPPPAASPAAVPSPAMPPKAPPKKRVATAEDKALVEAAEALLTPADRGTKDLANPYDAKVVGSGEKQYTGEPISLNLKDADVKDTLQKFSELTGLNIVLDPEVRGTVTISLNDVPWDQALELILRVNGLGYVFEGNVMRIATTTKLTSEEQNRLSLAKAQEASRPVKTIIQKLSYAQGSRLLPAIQKLMTPRGDVYYDQRSNSLIIKELPENIPVILDLIRNLDVPPQQVMIEARIVEATRTFSKSLGVAWGYNSVFDSAHGNTTGLIFPNNGRINGGLSLGANAIGSPANLLNLSLGNVLGSVQLDFALNAAEARGLVKIISSPKVQTTQLVQASIQSGVQVPVQTTVNNTTTVLYIDATLRLDVLPYITAEGTVVLDVKVQKREPYPGINLAAGNNVPLVTRDAQTTLLVRDGGTAVIGGIMKLTTNNQKNMVPGLWKIPLLGNLFQNYSDSDSTDELMIFITPRIMKSN